MRAQIARKKRREAPEATREAVERQLAWASGTEYFNRRDPLYHVTEQFQMTFDCIGRSHAATLLEESGGGFSEEENEQAEQERQGGHAAQSRRPRGQEGRQRTLPNSGIPMEAFAQTAFQRGTLSGAVLEGTGKMMLVSCLKRTVGQSGPKRSQQESLFGVGSQRRNIPGHDPDMVQFNRGFAASAVGVVVDTLRDARRVVQSMEDLAKGSGEFEKDKGGETLRAMYPFLDDSKERALIAEYEDKLRAGPAPEERPVLQNALVHARALLHKKAQMKVEFTNKLRLFSDRAAEMLAELEEPGAVEELAAALLEPEEGWPEPPESPEGGEPPHDPEGPARRGGPPDRAEARTAGEGAGAEGPPGPGGGADRPDGGDGPGPDPAAGGA